MRYDLKSDEKNHTFRRINLSLGTTASFRTYVGL